MLDPATGMKPPTGAVPLWVRRASITVLASAALLLGGCVAGVGYAGPSFYGEVDSGTDIYEAPPPLPVYVQPVCPGPGYLWTPGYWAYAGGYYWVPGTWVYPPQIGLLWTPGYWGFVGGAYLWHAGYWGPHVGFYGGVHYGFGYDGVGYVGGRWAGNTFVYNRYVTNVNVNVIHNTYVERVNRNVYVNRVSYNGGQGGIRAMPTRQEIFARRDAHVPMMQIQRQHMQDAARNPALFDRANGGRPPIAATPRPREYTGPGIERAQGAGRFGGARPQEGRPFGQPNQRFNGRQMQQPNARFNGRRPVQQPQERRGGRAERPQERRGGHGGDHESRREER